MIDNHVWTSFITENKTDGSTLTVRGSASDQSSTISSISVG